MYKALDFVLVRAPLLPIESYLSLADAMPKATANASTQTIDPRIRRALAIGSPSLLDDLDRTPTDNKKTGRLRAKLLRFLVRMSTRPTPYGAFAGVAIAGWGEHTSLSLDGPPRTRTRVDMDWLVRYVLMLEGQPAIRNQLKWLANSSAWEHHGRVILLEPAPLTAGHTGASVSVAAKSVVRRALDLARSPISYRVLVQRLLEDIPSATPERVERALQQLWETGFLRTELMPPATTEDPINWVRDRLAPITGGKSLCVQLDALLRTIAACDTVPIESVPGSLRKAAAHVGLLNPKNTDMPLQVDMELPLQGDCLSSAVASEAARAAEVLLKLTSLPGGPGRLSAYRQAFIARYGEDREVPLVELVHPDWGLGPIGKRAWESGNIAPERAARRTETLQRLALSAIRDSRLAVELDDKLLASLETHQLTSDRMPASLDINIFVLACSPAAIDAGRFQLLVGPNLGASVAGRNLGRFAHLLGAKAVAALERAARSDERFHPNCITAELTYLPRNFRMANVTVRPAVRHYEVAYGVSAGVDADHVIPLSELVVGVREGRFYVRWVSRNVDVVFASGHMLNPMRASPECELLSFISHDGITQMTAFDWGPANGYAFLPRVQIERTILQCARWRLDPITKAEAPVGNADSFADWFNSWREAWRVPRRVYLSWADNRLLYDLDDRAQVDDLRGELGRTRTQEVVLQEALPGPEHGWLPASDGGHHIAELVVSLVRCDVLSKPQALATHNQACPSPRVCSAVRLRPPGSDWLYLKLYGPRSAEDELLAGPVRTLCQQLKKNNIVDDWFFVRYADPDPHLRLRFHGPPQQLTGALFPQLCAWASALVSSGRCQRFMFDTYDREVERYGGPEGTSAAEALFAADSHAIVELLACKSRADRMLLTIVTIDDLLTALGLDDTARLTWLKHRLVSRKQSSDEYRRREKELIEVVCNPAKLELPIMDVLASRRASLAQASGRLTMLQTAGELTQPLTKLIESYVHMVCNRLLFDRSAEERALGLLMRVLNSITHQPELVSRRRASLRGTEGTFSVQERTAVQG